MLSSLNSDVRAMDQADQKQNAPSDLARNNRCCTWFGTYFSKWTGQHQTSPPAVSVVDCLITFFGTIISISILTAIHYRLLARYVNDPLSFVDQFHFDENLIQDLISIFLLLRSVLQR